MLALALVLLTSPVQAIADENWIEVKSANFNIYSDADEEKVRQLVVELELFRTVLGIITSTDLMRPDVPLTIIGTADSKGFAEIYGSGPLGVHYCTIYRCMAIADLTEPKTIYDATGKLVLFHEFVHDFLDVYSELNYPNWYHEGLAEYLASMTVKDGVVTVGLPAYHRFAALS